LATVSTTLTPKTTRWLHGLLKNISPAFSCGKITSFVANPTRFGHFLLKTALVSVPCHFASFAKTSAPLREINRFHAKAAKKQ
jgi:hypothetical protein